MFSVMCIFIYMSSVMCTSFLNFRFMETKGKQQKFLIMQDFLDMPQCFSSQLIIMHK